MLKDSVIVGIMMGIVLISASGCSKLEEKLVSDISSEREAALSDFRALDPERKQEVVKFLAESLKSTERNIKNNAAESIAQIGSDAKEVIPRIVDALKAPDDGHQQLFREDLVKALGAMGPNAKEGVPVLIEIIKDLVHYSRDSAHEALAKIGSASVPGLVQLISDNTITSLKVREDAIKTLGQIGPEAKDAVPTLTQLLSNPQENGYIRKSSQETLQKIGTPEAQSAIMNYGFR